MFSWPTLGLLDPAGISATVLGPEEALLARLVIQTGPKLAQLAQLAKRRRGAGADGAGAGAGTRTP
eukprot:11206291-Lingulodinium_polyedra.AAC.1